MSRRVLRRAIGATVVILAAASLTGHDIVHTTYALFDGETDNPGSVYAADYVAPPSALSITPSGYNFAAAWTTAASPYHNVTTQTLGYSVSASSATCSTFDTSGAYTTVSSWANHTTASYTDTGRASSTTSGDYYCYDIVDSSSSVNWTSGVTASARGGLTLLSVTLGNSNGAIAANDTIALTFNQPPKSPGATTTVCAFTTGQVYVGDTACSTTSDTYTIAKVVGTSTSITTKTTYTNSTVGVTGNVMTITLKGGSSRTVTGGTTWTITPSVLQLSNTGNVPACTTTANPTCTVVDTANKF